jgi:hypothetical protein
MTAEEYLKTKVIKFESLSETLEFTVYSLTKLMEEYHESELKKLRVTDVSGRSELLESFVKFVNERQFNKFKISLDEVELFLDSN